MRRTASEVVHELEQRVARLERATMKSARAIDPFEEGYDEIGGGAPFTFTERDVRRYVVDDLELMDEMDARGGKILIVSASRAPRNKFELLVTYILSPTLEYVEEKIIVDQDGRLVSRKQVSRHDMGERLFDMYDRNLSRGFRVELN